MFKSDAPGYILDRIKRLAGPNPKGSKLTDAERRHLIYLLGEALGPTETAKPVGTERLYNQLRDRGMTDADIAFVLGRYADSSVSEIADAIAVYPALKPPGDTA